MDRLTDGGGDAPYAPRAGDGPHHRRSLGRRRRLGRGRLLLHLSVALPQVKHLEGQTG